LWLQKFWCASANVPIEDLLPRSTLILVDFGTQSKAPWEFIFGTELERLLAIIAEGAF